MRKRTRPHKNVVENSKMQQKKSIGFAPMLF